MHKIKFRNKIKIDKHKFKLKFSSKIMFRERLFANILEQTGI